MARTLPWLASASSPTTSKSSPSTRAPKRQRLDDGGIASSPRTPTSRSQLHTPKKHDRTALPPARSSSPPASTSISASKTAAPVTSASKFQPPRTPSTSPPPAPPEIEYMRPGLNGDDIYVMVEDEFYAVAKTFTAHLHQAEYVRQRQLARERNAQGAAGIVRPVDGKTVLSAESKKEKERKRQDEQMKSGVAVALGDESWRGGTDGGKSRDGDVEVLGSRRRGAPATSLMGLMVSPSKARRSLVGIQGPGLKSRAAAGFGQAQTTPSKNRILGAPVELGLEQRVGIGAGSGTGAGSRTATWAENDEDSTTASETDSDDLDATPTGREYKPVSHSAKSPSRQSPIVASSSSASAIRKVLFASKTKSDPATAVDIEGQARVDRSSPGIPASASPPASDFDGFLRPTPLPKPGARWRGKDRESKPAGE